MSIKFIKNMITIMSFIRETQISVPPLRKIESLTLVRKSHLSFVQFRKLIFYVVNDRQNEIYFRVITIMLSCMLVVLMVVYYKIRRNLDSQEI